MIVMININMIITVMIIVIMTIVIVVIATVIKVAIVIFNNLLIINYYFNIPNHLTYRYLLQLIWLYYDYICDRSV